MPADDADHSFNDPRAQSGKYQFVENAYWPHDVRDIRDQPAEKQLEVTVRIVFRGDGETFLPGRAIRWRRKHVCVQVNDPRLQTGMVWVNASDVRRR